MHGRFAQRLRGGCRQRRQEADAVLAGVVRERRTDDVRARAHQIRQADRLVGSRARFLRVRFRLLARGGMIALWREFEGDESCLRCKEDRTKGGVR